MRVREVYLCAKGQVQVEHFIAHMDIHGDAMYGRGGALGFVTIYSSKAHASVTHLKKSRVFESF